MPAMDPSDERRGLGVEGGRVTDLMRAMYAAIQEMRDGGIAEVELMETVERPDGLEHTISISIRTEVKHVIYNEPRYD